MSLVSVSTVAGTLWEFPFLSDLHRFLRDESVSNNSLADWSYFLFILNPIIITATMSLLPLNECL